MAFNFFTAFHRALQDPEGYFSFQKEMNSKAVEQTFFNSLLGKTTFDAVVLPENLDSTTYEIGSVLRVRPLDIHDFIIPEPCTYAGDLERIKKIISLHPVAFPDSSVPFNSGNENAPSVEFHAGQVVECFFLQGPQGSGKMRGLRYRNAKFSAVNNVDLTCLGGGEKGAKAAFANGNYGLNDYGDPQRANYTGVAGNLTLTNGQLPSNVLGTTSNGVQVMIDTVDDLNKLAAAYQEEFKIPLHYSGYRLYDTQIKLYEDPEKVMEDGTHLAARPGTSNHGWGLAIDINMKDKSGVSGFNSKIYLWLEKNASKYNWYHPKWAQKPDGWPQVKKAPESGMKGSKPEPWHWEWSKKKTVFRKL